MSSDTTLRSILSRTDGSAVSIHQSAGAMMRHYDRAASVAVTEWRNALQNGRDHQLLPLLYVANEVLQNSKRNRGNQFLEAFSPILGQSLQYICQRAATATVGNTNNNKDYSVVEKVRRTAKIWGDRRVFSIRFVADLLNGLEMYRPRGGNGNGNGEDESTGTASPFSPSGGATFSPAVEEPDHDTHNTSKVPVLEEDTSKQDGDKVDDNITEESEDDDDDDDDDMGFGKDSQAVGHLDLDLTILDSNAFHSISPTTISPNNARKRKRRGMGSSPSTSRRKSILSTTSLVELWNHAANLQQTLEDSQALLRQIAVSPDGQQQQQQNVEHLVGEELVDHYRLVQQQQGQLKQQRHLLHTIAQEKRNMEQEAIRYIPWLQHALQQDNEDIVFCQTLVQQLQDFSHVHGTLKRARDQRRREERERQRQAEEEQRKRREEEERRQLLESAMKTETEAKPGMVWNKATHEYIYLNTDESWRD